MKNYLNSILRIQFLILFFATVVLSMVASSVLAQNDSSITIKLGEARTKKSLVAFPPLQPQGTPGAGAPQSVGTELYNVIVNNLNVSSYFQFLPQTSFVEDTAKTGLRPAPADPNGFNFQNWTALSTDFLIRGGFNVLNNNVNLEIYVYHVPRAQLVMGKKYTGPVSSARRIAHIFSNDLLKALTDKEGPFLSRFVVSSDRDGNNWREVFTMDWDGVNIDKISQHRSLTMSPAWSRDGKRIAYTATVQKKRGGSRNHDLFLYDLASKTRKIISFRPGMNSGASFAHDDQSIYLTLSQGNSPDIYRMDLNGNVIQRLTNGPNGAMNVEPSVSPDGKQVVFSSDRSGRTMIFTMNIDGTNVRRLTHAGRFNASPAWSPDGKKIAFAGYEKDHFDIFVMNADGTGMIRLTRATRPNGRMANNEDPSFSPDGRFVAYTSDRTGSKQIYISTVDGSEERRVTNDRFNYYKPRWSKNFE